MTANETLRNIIIERMQNEDYEIKSCPFCGGNNIHIMSKKFFDELVEEHDTACITVECKDCHLTMYDHTLDENDYYIRKLFVTEKWNKRA